MQSTQRSKMENSMRSINQDPNMQAGDLEKELKMQDMHLNEL